MQVYLAGTRGSAPITSPQYAIFGGDTSGLLILGDRGETLLLDAGSGTPALAPRLGPDPDLFVLFTHFHLDHLIGLATFQPLYTPKARLCFAAPPTDGMDVETALRGFFRSPYWPIDLDRAGAQISFGDLPSSSGGSPLRIGGLEVRWVPVPHPGGCTSYRIDEPATGASLVLATDAEWANAPEHLREGFLGLCREPKPCDVLICDGQYAPEEAALRQGWGHSAWNDAVDLARAAGVGQLLITHHDPGADDSTLQERETQLQAALPGAALARQGQELILPRKDTP